MPEQGKARLAHGRKLVWMHGLLTRKLSFLLGWGRLLQVSVLLFFGINPLGKDTK